MVANDVQRSDETPLDSELSRLTAEMLGLVPDGTRAVVMVFRDDDDGGVSCGSAVVGYPEDDAEAVPGILADVSQTIEAIGEAMGVGISVIPVALG